MHGYLLHILVYLFIHCFLFGSQLNGQIRVEATWTNEILKTGANYAINPQQNLQVERLRFYISHCNLYHNEQVVAHCTDSIIMIDIDSSRTLYFVYDKPLRKPNRLLFFLGIDSISSCSGAYEGALDPLKGMYWTWQSGYINLKLEGEYQAGNLSKKPFQYHIGGYQYPYNAQRSVELELKKGHGCSLNLPVDQLIRNWDIDVNSRIMRPGLLAQRFADLVAQSFYISYD
jgi:hypothetical protein